MFFLHVLAFLWASIQSQDCCSQVWNQSRIPSWNQSLCVASGRPPINPNPITITHPSHSLLYLFSLKCPKQCLPNLPKRKHSPQKTTKHLKTITRALQRRFVYLLKRCAVWNYLFSLVLAIWVSPTWFDWKDEVVWLYHPPPAPDFFGAIKPEVSSSKCHLSFAGCDGI